MKKTIYIKNMVCQRCIKVITDEITTLGYKIEKIKLGEVVLNYEKEFNLESIKNILYENGFELIDDQQRYLIEQIKIVIIEYIQSFENSENLSDYLAKKIGYSYQYLSNLFTTAENITIQKYIIYKRIEKIKELIIYNQLTFSQISDKLGYSSIQHLSNQFKKITGLSPSKFKALSNKKRKYLDQI